MCGREIEIIVIMFVEFRITTTIYSRLISNSNISKIELKINLIC